MSLLDMPNPLEIPGVQSYYEDIYRFKINNSFDELQFSKGKINYDRLCRRLAKIELPDPSLLPYQSITLEELISSVKEILNKLFDNAYKIDIEELLNRIILDPLPNPFDAVLEENYNGDKLLGHKIHLSDKLASIEIVATAHEIVHALLSKYYGPTYNSHLNNIHYKELLSIIVEYIVCYELSKTLHDDLSTKQRINRLYLNNNNIKELEQMIINLRVTPPILLPTYKLYTEYIEHTGFGNVISDVYGRRLLDLYKDDPSTLLKLVQGTIDGNKQIKDLIKFYRLSLTDKPTIYGYYDSVEETLEKAKTYKK